MRIPSVMGHQFAQVPKVEIPRSQFQRNSGHKTTFDAGYLVPIFLDEIYPGDTFQLSMTALVKMLSPLKSPIMDNLFFESFFFFVPNRLVWNNWQRFNGEQDDPDSSTDFTVPEMAGIGAGYSVGQLGDYFGLPIGVAQTGTPGNYNWTHSALPFRAYSLIYNQWFRDENLVDSAVVDKDDGPDDAGDYPLRRRGKRFDYFTSALPRPQKGDPVSLPLGTSALVTSPNTTAGAISIQDSGGTPRAIDTSGAVAVIDASSPAAAALYADLSTATSATINQLRQAFAVQRLLERDARGGTRYIEIIRSHFGVTSPDARLQRAEYLGGGSSMISVSEISNNQATSGATLATSQGWNTAVGRAGATGHGFTKSFVEHGWVIGLVSVRADLTYQQRVDRMWSRWTREEFLWPALTHIGEQAIESREIYCDGSVDDADPFGYVPRYDELRYKASQITGKFRSAASGSLDYWHLSQEFSTRPTLNQTFIEEDPPLDRVIAVTSEPHFILDTYFSMKCARPLPLFGVPGMMDHF